MADNQINPRCLELPNDPNPWRVSIPQMRFSDPFRAHWANRFWQSLVLQRLTTISEQLQSNRAAGLDYVIDPANGCYVELGGEG